MRGTIGWAIGMWRLFKEIEPGLRFQSRYDSHRRRRETGDASKWGRIFNLAGGLALIVAGFLFAYIVIVIGLWILAGEFRPLARFFDRLDVRLRRLGRWIKGRWNALPTSVKVLVVLVCVAALGYGAYHLLLAVW